MIYKLLFLRFIVEVEGELHDLPEVVLDVDVDGLLVGRCGGVVKSEHLAFERIAVVGQEHRTVAMRSVPLPSGWK